MLLKINFSAVFSFVRVVIPPSTLKSLRTQNRASHVHVSARYMPNDGVNGTQVYSHGRLAPVKTLSVCKSALGAEVAMIM